MSKRRCRLNNIPNFDRLEHRKMNTSISEIRNKFEVLLKERKDLRYEVEQLKASNKALQNEFEGMKSEMGKLKEKSKAQAIANSMESTSDRTSAKLKINELVREIDRCVAMINK